jgi:hypothetical protein
VKDAHYTHRRDKYKDYYCFKCGKELFDKPQESAVNLFYTTTLHIHAGREYRHVILDCSTMVWTINNDVYSLVERKGIEAEQLVNKKEKLEWQKNNAKGALRK